MKFCLMMLLAVFFTSICHGQNNWNTSEAETIFKGVEIDVESALEMLKEEGVTPYDFGIDLLAAGHGEKLKSGFKHWPSRRKIHNSFTV